MDILRRSALADENFLAKQSDEYVISLYNDALEHPIYASLNGSAYCLIEPHKTHTFSIDMQHIAISVLQADEDADKNPVLDFETQPSYYASIVIDTESPRQFTLTYSSIKALQEFSVSKELW